MSLVVARLASVLVCDDCGGTHSLKRPSNDSRIPATVATQHAQTAMEQGWLLSTTRTDDDRCPACAGASRTTPTRRVLRVVSGTHPVARSHVANDRPSGIAARVRALLNHDDDSTTTEPA